MIVQDLAASDTLRFQNPGAYVKGVDADGNAVQIGGVPPPPSTAAASPTRFTNAGANATLNVKATAGNVFSCSCLNTNAASRYLQLHDTATVPAGGATPAYTFLVPTGAMVGIGTDFFTNGGAHFVNGIAFAFSTTLATYTAGTAGEQFTVVHYA